jgi:predicted hydrocarbon binding protein
VPKEKDVMVLQRERGAKLYLVGVTLEQKPGAFVDLASRLEKGGFRILSGFVGSPQEGGSRCSWYMEATVGRPSKEEVKEALELSPYCKGVEVVEGRNGVLVDSLNFPLRWNSGERAMVIRTRFFDAMERTIQSLLSSGADIILYQMGLDHGTPSWSSLLRDIRVEAKEDLQAVAHVYSAVGWGRVEVLSFDKRGGKAGVRVSDCFECAGEGADGRTGCNFFRGHLAGLFAAAMGGGKVNVTETKCTSKGDPACEYSAEASP